MVSLSGLVLEGSEFHLGKYIYGLKPQHLATITSGNKIAIPAWMADVSQEQLGNMSLF